MNALYSDEQRMFAASLVRLGAAVAVKQPADLGRVDRARGWEEIAQVGLLGLRHRYEGAPVASGVEVMIAAEALGRALAPQPFVGSGVMALELLGLSEALDDWTGPLVDGSGRCAVLLTRDLSSLASFEDEDAVAWDAEGATAVLALVHAGGGARIGRTSIAKGFAAAEGADITRRILVRSGPVGAVETAPAPWDQAKADRWSALAMVALNADSTGALQQAHRDVVAYSRDRIQYGVPIGSFQAVQHICAEMLVQIETSHVVNAYAAWAVDALPPGEALLAARTAKAYCASIALPVAEAVMQVYGGIGQTWEHIAHLVARRVMTNAQVLGGEVEQLDRIADARLTRQPQGATA